uniref:Leishmanolysin-like peptidase n=1 Tax=Heterorhabditis bacteriophora TaxID=37862 RepID=A0A1I7X6L4_HETBA
MKPRLLHYSLNILLFIPTWLALPCSYKSPRVEDILFEVPVEEKVHSRLQRSTSEEFEPLRIHLHYDESVLALSPEKQKYVNSSLLPEAAGYWEHALRVRRMDGPIRLRRKCISSYYYFRAEKKSVACDKGCRDWTTCGDAVIPKEHLLCSYCISSDDCYTSGALGEGILEADFILYVTAISTKRCDSIDTLAYAAHCQQEARLDRPIAGHVNLCPSALSTHRHDQEILVSTVKHEILHALGFSVGLYAFFRDEHGRPRTKRCTSQRDSLALCNLVPYKKQLPLQFRNFASIEGVSDEGMKHYGGSVELADFCPYSQEFEWKMLNSTARRDSRCELEGNNREGEDILEVYGPFSRCFDFIQPWTERKCGRMRTLSHYMAGCYEHVCENGTLFIGIHNSTSMYPCHFEGQHIHIHRVMWILFIYVVSLSFANALFPYIPIFLGDPALDEPCSSCMAVLWTSLTVTILGYFLH